MPTYTFRFAAELAGQTATFYPLTGGVRGNSAGTGTVGSDGTVTATLNAGDYVGVVRYQSRETAVPGFSGSTNARSGVTVEDLLDPASDASGALKAAYATVAGPAAQWPLRHFAQRIRAVRGGTARRVKWLTMFDSYAQKITQPMAPYLANAVGGQVAGGYFSGGTAGAVTVNSSSGTITDNTADFTSWPSGLTSVLAAGASRTYGAGGSTFTVPADTIRVFWINDGGGTFKIQVDGVDNTTPTVTTGGGLGVATLSVTLGSHTVTIVGLTGNSKIVGVGWESSTASGMCFINVAQGGIALNSPSAQAWTNFGTFLATVQPDVLLYEAKEDSSWLAAGLDSLLTTTQANATHCDVVLVQSPPQSTNDTDNVAQNAIVRAKATQYGVTTWDSYSIFQDWATLSALGWGGDGTHVSADADAFRGMLMFRDLGVFNIAGVQPLDTQATNVSAYAKVLMGKTPSAPVLEWDADLATDLDVTAKIKRQMKWTDTSGTLVGYIDSRNSQVNPSAMPRYSQFGDGMGGIEGTTASSVSAKQGGAFNLFADFRAKTFVAGQKSITYTSGTLTLDLSQGGFFVVTLQASVTNLTVTNALTSGQEFRVVFIQDATGGRTLGSSVGPLKFAGKTIPTLTAAAGSIDCFTFVANGSSYYEFSRALNVG